MDEPDDKPHALIRPMNFGCGAILGLVVGGSICGSFILDFDGAWLAIPICSLALGVAAACFRESFWTHCVHWLAWLNPW